GESVSMLSAATSAGPPAREEARPPSPPSGPASRSADKGSPADRQPPVDHQRVSADIGGSVGGEKERRAADLLGLSVAPEDRSIHHTLPDLIVVDQRRGKPRLDQSGGDGIDPDSAGPHFL